MPITVVIQNDWWSSFLSVTSTVATAVAAVGSAGALVVAALVYRRQGNDSRSQQASRVLTFVRDGNGSVEWAAQNLSDLPIYEVAYMAPVPPGDPNRKLVNGHVVFERIDPIFDIGTARFTLTTQQQGAMYVSYPKGDQSLDKSVIEFTDAAGHRWRRQSNGDLGPAPKRESKRSSG